MTIDIIIIVMMMIIIISSILIIHVCMNLVLACQSLLFLGKSEVLQLCIDWQEKQPAKMKEEEKDIFHFAACMWCVENKSCLSREMQKKRRKENRKLQRSGSLWSKTLENFSKTLVLR